MAGRGAEARDRRGRIVGLLGALGLALVAISGQLLNLQVLSGEHRAQLSDKNRLRVRPVAAPRGIVFDRTGLPLVDNRPAFILVVVPRDVPDLPAVLDRLAGLLRLPVADLAERLRRGPPGSPWPGRPAPRPSP